MTSVSMRVNHKSEAICNCDAPNDSWRNFTSLQSVPGDTLPLPSYLHGEQEKSWSSLEREDTGEMLAI